MKNKYKFLMSVLAVTLLMTGFMSAGGSSGSSSASTTTGKATFDLGYDCYHQPNVWLYDCKQVEHKSDWFIKKGFHTHGGFCGYDPDTNTWTCHYTWHRFPKQ